MSKLFSGAQWLHENPQSDQDPKAYSLIVEQIGRRHTKLYRSDDGRGRTTKHWEPFDQSR
jgi:hypothetical protein